MYDVSLRDYADQNSAFLDKESTDLTIEHVPRRLLYVHRRFNRERFRCHKVPYLCLLQLESPLLSGSYPGLRGDQISTGDHSNCPAASVHHRKPTNLHVCK